MHSHIKYTSQRAHLHPAQPIGLSVARVVELMHHAVHDGDQLLRVVAQLLVERARACAYMEKHIEREGIKTQKQNSIRIMNDKL
jgi:hypothetical protein